MANRESAAIGALLALCCQAALAQQIPILPAPDSIAGLAATRINVSGNKPLEASVAPAGTC